METKIMRKPIMKRMATILLLSMSAITGFSQTQNFGIQLAFTEPILRMNKSSVTSDFPKYTTVNGFKAGIIYDATLIKGFGMSMGLNYAISGRTTAWQKESTYTGTVTNTTGKELKRKNVIQTIELPIDWQYKFEVAQKTYLIVFTGPTIQYNFYYKTTNYVKDFNPKTGTKEETQNKYNHYSVDLDGDDNKDFTPFNIQWGVGLGVQYERYFIRANYDFGIYNHFRDSYYDSSVESLTHYNRGRLDQWSVRVGIYFWQQ